jgi:hypothetical protein
MQHKDYKLFSQDFNANMLKNFPQANFDKRIDYFTTYGAFKSVELTDVQIIQTYYQVTFAKKTLKMGILLPEKDFSHISGLWFE